MVRCEALAGKVVQTFSLFEDGPYGPEINIEFTDGTVFNSCLKTASTLEAKLLRNSPSWSVPQTALWSKRGKVGPGDLVLEFRVVR